MQFVPMNKIPIDRISSDDVTSCRRSSRLTGVEQQEELEAGDLSAVQLQRPQPGRQLLTPLDQSGQRGLRLGQDEGQLHLEHRRRHYSQRDNVRV